ncbi:hypothetical protein LTR95_009054 [Oleoguttula sp. CCFEE 5521]
MAQPRSHLLDLPPELRLRIYELLFQPQVCYLKVARAVYTKRKSAVPDTGRKEHLPEPMHLLRTCRLIYQEALPVFYKHTIFDIEIRNREYGTTASFVYRGPKQSTSFPSLLATLLRKFKERKSLAHVHFELSDDWFYWDFRPLNSLRRSGELTVYMEELHEELEGLVLSSEEMENLALLVEGMRGKLQPCDWYAHMELQKARQQ